MSPDIHTLTGAYAADALPEEERRFFERHLAECRACAAEVMELQATAARLGAAMEEVPPPAMRGHVMAAIDRTRQERPVTSRDATSGGRAVRWQRALAAVAGVSALVAVALGGMVADLNGRLADLEAAESRLVAVMSAPDAVIVEAAGADGSLGRVIASGTTNQAVFVIAGMPPAPADHVYEAWVIDDAGPVPAGLFDVDTQGRATHWMDGDMSDVVAIAVTIEPAGGSPQPTSEPLMVIDLST